MNANISNPERFAAAIARIDAANSDDPTRRTFEGAEYPYALLYGMRMSHWLDTLDCEAPEAVQLAVRAQHVCRWKIPARANSQWTAQRLSSLADGTL